jgi:integrase/recombinase XerD
MPKGLYTRNGIYWARFKVRGIEYRESLRTRRQSVAEKRLKAVREAIEERVFYGAAEEISWQQAVVSWNEKGARALGIKASTFDRYVTSIGQLDPFLGDKMLHEIDNKLLKQIVAERQRHGTSNATIRRDMTAASSVLAHAVDQEWIDENPAKTIDRSRFKERKARIILPRPDSLALVFADQSRFMDMARLSRLSGMREEEIAGLKHDVIDRARRTATLEDTKGNRVREVTLSPEALAVIDRQPRHIKQRYVFWHGNGDRFTAVPEQWRNKIKAAARKAAQDKVEFVGFRFHDLRHLFAVEFLRDRRGSIYALQQELGHASIATTERYLDHLTSEEKIWAKHGVAQNAAQMQRSEEQK